MTVLIRFVVVCLLVSPAIARNYYVTPSGAGEKHGGDWASAMPQTSVNELLADNIQPGDRVLLGSGTYGTRHRVGNVLFRISRSGSKGKPITLMGVDTGGGRPRIVGQWKPGKPRYHAHSWAAVSLQQAVSYVRIKGIDISDCMHAITTHSEHTGLQIEAINVRSVREAIVLRDVTDTTVTTCSLARYTKKGISFEKGCRNVSLTDVLADGNGGDRKWVTEEYPFGFAINDDKGHHDIRYLRCVAKNNLHQGGENEYWNGDGFVAEAGASGIRYEDCIAMDNNDGGWDDKSTAATLIGCIAVRNKRNIRLWNVQGSNEKPSRLIRCVGAFAVRRGARSNFVGLWVGGSVVAEQCTFYGNLQHAVSVASGKRPGRLILKRCVLSHVDSNNKSKLVQIERGGSVKEEATIRWPMNDAKSPAIKAKPDWAGEPRGAFVSERYAPQAGYVLFKK